MNKKTWKLIDFEDSITKPLTLTLNINLQKEVPQKQNPSPKLYGSHEQKHLKTNWFSSLHDKKM
jgi:hypothetical protein